MAERLANNGFTLRQLLDFWLENANPRRSEGTSFECTGQINFKTTTNEVVKTILIPQSAGKGAYMNVMKGGKHKADVLVSHWWGARFYDDILCIAQHATGLSGYFLEFFVNNDLQHDEDALEELGVHSDVFEKTYWMCIFAVDEHISICGECWGCHKALGDKWEAAHYRADPCLVCGKAKYNPCSCGSVKYPTGHPLSEVDKFHKV